MDSLAEGVNPFGIIIFGLGLILIIIGFKGSQHSVIDALTGHAGSGKTSTAGNTSDAGSTASNM